MFAPPPLQLSRAEIQHRLQLLREANGESDAKPARQSNSPSNKASISSPIKTTRFSSKSKHATGSQAPPKQGIQRLATLPVGFGENPRQAPTPPRRAATLPNDATPRLIPGAFPGEVAPPIPPKSAKRQDATHREGSDAILKSLDFDTAGLMFDGKIVSTSQRNRRPKRSSSSAGKKSRSAGGVRKVSTGNKIPTREPAGVDFQSNLPAPWPFTDKKLPDIPPRSPEASLETPTPIPRGGSRSKTWGKKRRPLAQVSSNSAKSNSPSAGGQDMLSRLSVIPEVASLRGKSPRSSGSCSPRTTSMQLHDGSILTVTPPELTPWTRRVYIQGPIKLPKPLIVPRKNSLASLEPFQEAVDDIYEEALDFQRRASEIRVLDDICDFFEEFEMGPVSFAGDILATADDFAGASDEKRPWFDGFGTPSKAEVSPIEKMVAKAVVEAMNGPMPVPPLENEETIRAKGKARFAKQTNESEEEKQRKDSATLASGFLPLLPLPGESIMQAVLGVAEEKSKMKTSLADQGEDGMEELGPASDWTLSGVMGSLIG
ncbi:hypothetical protein BDY17DRAFT_326296 [Neohortaea acidophila]|uniref:Uncharacterized protein n=1 Tax=Neohortaea acidophila TaxID=245834 RepID=A0A6A6PK46_9PEZI|nr:uncharacterized protein BDY17DRAFT_326296 [Neohortaea acidophila]KAF2480389.1 hypothetical protein BDY17DRAFT_326296 [Neohortaea acidophila]